MVAENRDVKDAAKDLGDVLQGVKYIIGVNAPVAFDNLNPDSVRRVHVVYVDVDGIVARSPREYYEVLEAIVMSLDPDGLHFQGYPVWIELVRARSVERA